MNGRREHEPGSNNYLGFGGKGWRKSVDGVSVGFSCDVSHAFAFRKYSSLRLCFSKVSLSQSEQLISLLSLLFLLAYIASAHFLVALSLPTLACIAKPFPTHFGLWYE